LVTFYLIYHLGREYAPRSCWIGLLSTYIPRCQSFSLVRCKASSPDPRSTWNIGCYITRHIAICIHATISIVTSFCLLNFNDKNLKTVLRICNLFVGGTSYIIHLCVCIFICIWNMEMYKYSTRCLAEPTYGHWIKNCMIIQTPCYHTCNASINSLWILIQPNLISASVDRAARTIKFTGRLFQFCLTKER